MKIIIYCTEDQACAVRDALHNYYHDAKPFKSERGHFLADSCNIIADYLKEGIAQNMRLVTVWLIK